VLAHVKDGVLTKVEPGDFPEPGYRYSCLKSLCTPQIVYHPERLKYPMKRVGERGEGKWQRISWDEALDTIASRLKDIAERYGPESVAYLNAGLSLPSGGFFSGQRFASASEATFIAMSGIGYAAHACANTQNFGAQFAEYFLWDHDDPRLVVLWGENLLETARWKYRRIRDAREKGAKMVVISPVFTPTAAKAHEWIPIRPGTDAALVLGMLNIIMSEGLYDESFISEHTDGPFLVRGDNGLFLREENIPSGDSTTKYMIWDTKTNKPQTYDTPGVSPVLRGSYTIDGMECKPALQLLAELAEQYPLERTSEITGVAPDAIRRLALDYATRKPVRSNRGLGSARTFHGDLSHRAIVTLAAVTGNISLKGIEDVFAGLNWMPFMMPGGRFYKQIQIMQFYDAVMTEQPYPIKALWTSTHDPLNAQAHRNKWKEMLSRMEFIVVVDIFMTDTAEHADIVLPGCTSFEYTSLALPWGLYFGTHTYLQLQPKVIEPYHECKSDLEIFTELAKRMDLEEFFNQSAEEYIELLLSSGHPSMEGITLEKLREGPMKPKPSVSITDTTPTGRLDLQAESEKVEPSGAHLFNTPSGRLEFYSEKLKEFGQELPVFMEPLEGARQPLAQKYPLTFFQLHSRFRHHTLFLNVDWLRELYPEPLLHMNPVDAEKRGIQDGEMVTAFNDRGSVTLKARLNEAMMPGLVSVAEGWRPVDFTKGSHQELTHNAVNPAQQATVEANAAMQDVLCEVRKA
jgi:molybdopterin-containing oxidoreductase family molybdopterin binding subunit